MSNLIRIASSLYNHGYRDEAYVTLLVCPCLAWVLFSCLLQRLRQKRDIVRRDADCRCPPGKWTVSSSPALHAYLLSFVHVCVLYRLPSHLLYRCARRHALTFRRVTLDSLHCTTCQSEQTPRPYMLSNNVINLLWCSIFFRRSHTLRDFALLALCTFPFLSLHPPLI